MGQSERVSEDGGDVSGITGREAAVWTFVRVEGIDPTNNAAEVRFVGQKPDRFTVWGIGPRLPPDRGWERENGLPMSGEFRPPLVKG
jgi:hypothetical protein